jgi:hypothetical protein
MAVIDLLSAIANRPHSFKPTGPEDSRFVSDEQLNRHFIWRIEMWEKRWPHKSRDLSIRAVNLIRRFASKPDLEYIAQQHRWEFLERLRKLPERYLT